MKTRKLKRPNKRRMKGGVYNASKGSRFMYLKPRNTRFGRTGRVLTNINDEHILGEFNDPKTVEIIRKGNLNSMGEPCEKRCATCECIPYKTLRNNMPHNSIPGKPPMPIKPVLVPINENEDDWFNKQKKYKNFNAAMKKYTDDVKIYQEYERNHAVKQGEYMIRPKKHKLTTTSLATCSALAMDITSDSGPMHFFTHIDGGETDRKITEMIQDIKSHCSSENLSECIHNIKIWAGAGSEKERGQYMENPNVISMPVIIKVLRGLDLINVIGDKIYYKGTSLEIPVVKTCFRHYVGDF